MYLHLGVIMSEKKEKLIKKQASREQKFFNKWRRLFQYIITHICYMIRLKLVYRLEVHGLENVPKDNAYIVAPNHLSTLDPPMIAGVVLAYKGKYLWGLVVTAIFAALEISLPGQLIRNIHHSDDLDV